MNFNPFCGCSLWLKGNLHAHSTLSDGTATPEELKAMYLKQGYAFIAYTDHDFFPELSCLNDDTFLAYPGAELKVYPPQLEAGCGDYRTYHLLCLAGPEFDGAAEPVEANERIKPLRCGVDWQVQAQALIDRMSARGCLVTVNHPVWSRLLPEDLLALDRLFALEIYNAQCALDGDDTGEGALYWDLLLRRGKRVWGFAADDNHNRVHIREAGAEKADFGQPRCSSCRAWVMVGAVERSRKAIAEALAQGRFYSSTGPEITRYEIVNGHVHVACSPVSRIDFITYERRGCSVADGGEVSQASYTLHGDEKYVRVQCTDAVGRRAWTNPIFLR